MKKNLHGETRNTRGRIQELLLSKQFKTSGQKSKVVETEKCQYLIQQVSWGLILCLISTKLLITSLLPLFAWCPARPVPGNQWYRELTYQVSLWTSCHGVTNERWFFAKMWLQSMRAILDPLCVWNRNCLKFPATTPLINPGNRTNRMAEDWRSPFAGLSGIWMDWNLL